MTAYIPATETDELLTSDTNVDNKKRSIEEASSWIERCIGCKARSQIFILSTCCCFLTISLLAVLTCYTYYESHVRQWESDRLMQQYKKEADEALILLNDMSTTNVTSSALRHNDESRNKVTNTKLQKKKKQNNHIPLGCESTLLILRHCEDLGGHVRYEDGTSHCSYLGFQRSLYLATLFGNNTHDGSVVDNNNARWPIPSKLYGMWNKDGTNKRQYESLRPLSEKAGDIPIVMFDFESAAIDLRDEIFQLLSSGSFCNQVVVVAWKHAYIRPLAATLGCDQERGCPDTYGDYDFDTVWELQYVYKPEQLQAYPEGESVLHHKDKSLVEGWKVFGSVTKEGFDALHFKRDTYNSLYNNDTANWMKHPGHRV